MNDNKKYYQVCISGEDYSYGYVRLTEAEAEFLSRVTDPNNWQNANIGQWTGRFTVDLDHPLDSLER